MNLEEIRKRQHASPFRPFVLHLSDGRNAMVDHPELIIVPPDDADTVIVWELPGGSRILDAGAIVEISLLQTKNGRGKSKSRRR
ncbi:MAG: hypothetical protein ABIZ56_06555 [Chthoniobacteraceae bacterium]